MTRKNDDPTDDKGRWSVLFDLLIFQIKLLLDGLKDIVLGPLSIVAAVIDALRRHRPPDRHLDQVMRIGERFDKWIDLYNLDAKTLAAKPPAISQETDRDDAPKT